MQSDAIPVPPGLNTDSYYDNTGRTHKVKPKGAPRNSDTWKKIQERRKEEKKVKEAEKMRAEVKRIAVETNNLSQILDKKVEEPPIPEWQQRSDDYVNKTRSFGPVGATNHAADLNSMNFMSKVLIEHRAMQLEAEKAGIKWGDHPYKSRIARSRRDEKIIFSSEKVIDKAPPLTSDKEYREIRNKIDPHLVEKSLDVHLAKDNYKGIAKMYKGYSKYELSQMKMTESELEARYEARLRFEMEAEQAQEYPLLHSAAKVVNPASILMVTPIGRVSHLAGGIKLAIPLTALAGAGA